MGAGDTGELLRDTLDVLILKAVTPAARHGYAIAEFIEARSNEVPRVEEGAVYPDTARWHRVAGAITRILRTA